jgi:pyruvate dehydrogenase E1 component beta subunit
MSTAKPSAQPSSGKMVTATFREAIGQAIAEEMTRDPNVFLMGEEVGFYQGAYKVSQGLLERFGPTRVIDTPIAESGFAGLGVGAAMTGLRPIIEFMTFNFSFVAMDPVINAAAKARQMSGGQLKVPIVFRGANGAGGRLAAQHSQSCESFFCHIPGLKVVAPGTVYDAKGLLKSSIRDDDPVIFLESEKLYGLKGEVPEGVDLTIPLGKAEVKRVGKDVTLVAWSRMLGVALEAAEKLAVQGVQAEVWDPRTLRPLDEESLFASVRKTNRVVIIEESWPYAGVGAEISDRIQRNAFDDLDAPVERVTQRDVPMPYAAALENASLPSTERIVAAVKKVLYV